MQDQREEQYIEEEALRKAEDYKIQTIGLVDVSDGQDQYLLVEDNTDGFPDQTSLDILWRYVRDRYCYDTDTPGAWFCHQISVLEHRKGNSAIVIVHNRRNV